MLKEMGVQARQASACLARLMSKEKNRALFLIAEALEREQSAILLANQQDLEAAQQLSYSAALLDRLRLTPQRLALLQQALQQVIQLPDPLEQPAEYQILPSGLQLKRQRVPIGVIGVIYELRPNVTLDVSALCLKSGNAVILRGGKETQQTNHCLVTIIHQALIRSQIDPTAVQLIPSADRRWVNELICADKSVDLLITRGGEALHRLCREQATVPVINGGAGICHLFVDASADLERSLPLILNAKVQQPSTCNALETLLVHRSIASKLLPLLSEALALNEVTLHADPAAITWLSRGPAKVRPLCKEELDQEWLSLDLNLCLVEDIDEAIMHIHHHSSGHSEGILTQDASHAQRFTQEIDAAVVYVNASSRFPDGGQFGIGAEMAISTQKLHVRGPMGLESLTTVKWIAEGDYLVRN
ncbi:MAG: glutamate-5-semialdehyde dehydrogenase [Candidatus Symbiodolus clandestinus]